MGIEPTKGPSEPDTGFEDQGRHQAPVTSASPMSPSLPENRGLSKWEGPAPTFPGFAAVIDCTKACRAFSACERVELEARATLIDNKICGNSSTKCLGDFHKMLDRFLTRDYATLYGEETCDAGSLPKRAAICFAAQRKTPYPVGSVAARAFRPHKAQLPARVVLSECARVARHEDSQGSLAQPRWCRCPEPDCRDRRSQSMCNYWRNLCQQRPG